MLFPVAHLLYAHGWLLASISLKALRINQSHEVRVVVGNRFKD